MAKRVRKPVFMDTGGGDIYAGPTKKAVIAAMRKDCDDTPIEDIFEVPGTMKMRVEDDDGMAISTLEEEYVEGLGAYCIASENC